MPGIVKRSFPTEGQGDGDGGLVVSYAVPHLYTSSLSIADKWRVQILQLRHRAPGYFRKHPQLHGHGADSIMIDDTSLCCSCI